MKAITMNASAAINLFVECSTVETVKFKVNLVSTGY